MFSCRYTHIYVLEKVSRHHGIDIHIYKSCLIIAICNLQCE